MAKNTLQQHKKVIEACKALFSKKNKDYGTAWRILRLPALTDQLMIKAMRIRSLQKNKKQKVSDSITTELVGIINYAIMALIQIKLGDKAPLALPYKELEGHYDQCVAQITTLLSNKNHDYDEAWRKMRLISMVDIILMKLLRIKNIEDNHGFTIVSEDVQAGYQDIVNYAAFLLIRLLY